MTSLMNADNARRGTQDVRTGRTGLTAAQVPGVPPSQTWRSGSHHPRNRPPCFWRDEGGQSGCPEICVPPWHALALQPDRPSHGRRLLSECGCECNGDISPVVAFQCGCPQRCPKCGYNEGVERSALPE